MARFNPSSALRLRFILFLIPCLFSFRRPFDRLTAQTGAIVHPVTALGVPCSQSSCAVMHFWAGGIGPKSSRILGNLRGSRWGVDSAVPRDSSEELAHTGKERARMCCEREVVFPFLLLCNLQCQLICLLLSNTTRRLFQDRFSTTIPTQFN